MANIKSAKKQAKQNVVRQAQNQSRRTEIKTLTKKLLEILDGDDLASAKEMLKVVESKIARAKCKKVLKKNTASRKISTLARKIAAKAAAPTKK